MISDLDKLKEVLTSLDEKRAEVRNVLTDLELTPKAKGLLGKYFKYKNQYGADSWWQYIHITSLYKEPSHVIYFSFEANVENVISFEFDKYGYTDLFYAPLCKYIEITKKEFLKAQTNLLNKLQKRLEKEKGL